MAPDKNVRDALPHLFTVDAAEGKLYWKNTSYVHHKVRGKLAGTPSKGYLRVRVFGSTYNVHSVIFYLVYGWWPDMLDHADRNTLNNRPDNLRPTDKTQNNYNRGPTARSKTGVKGVFYRPRHTRNPYEVLIAQKSYGSYATLEAAAEKAAEIYKSLE